MKVIFLDFDGVMNTAKHCSKPGYWKDPCDTPHVEVLNTIIERTGAKVVISSVWRMDGIDNCRMYLGNKGFKGEIIGTTPVDSKNGDTRGHEIQEWMDTHPGVEKFVVLDDDTDMTGVERWFVHIDRTTGLTEDHIPLVLKHIG